MKTISLPLRNEVSDLANNMFASYGAKTWNAYDPVTRVLTSDNSTFVSEGVQPGMVVFNSENSNSWATVETVDSETEITLTPGFIYESDGGTRLPRFSIATAAVAFTQECSDIETSKYWWSKYKVGDRVQSQGQQIKTSFNKAVATILKMELVNDLAVMTLDKPLQSSRSLWVYKEGSVYTLDIKSVATMEMYTYHQQGDGGDCYMTFYDINGSTTYEVFPWLYNPTSEEETRAVAKELQDKLINAIEQSLRSPWPAANVMVEDSYGLKFDYYT